MVTTARRRQIRHRPSNGRIQELNREEGRVLFDEQARKYLNMSGEEFLRAWDAGEFKDPDRPEVLRVAMLIPFVR